MLETTIWLLLETTPKLVLPAKNSTVCTVPCGFKAALRVETQVGWPPGTPSRWLENKSRRKDGRPRAGIDVTRDADGR